MSMQEPTDDQLDGLFRKSAEEFNAPFDPAAWQALKNRLDTHDRFTIWEHLLRWGTPVLLLLILIGGSWNAYQQRAVAGQSSGTGVAARQPISTNGNPVPDRSTQKTDNDQLPVKKKVVDPLRSDGLAGTDVAQSDKPKPPVLTDEANAMVGNVDDDADKTSLSPTIRKRDGSVTPGAANAQLRLDKATIRTGSTYRERPVRSSSTTNRGLTVKRPERVRVGTGQQIQSRRLFRKRSQTSVTATFPETSNAMKPVQPFNKQQTGPDVTGAKSGNKLQPGNRLIPGDNAIEAHRFNAGASDRNGLQPAADEATTVALPSFVELTNRPGQWPKPLSFSGREVTVPISSIETKQPVSAQPIPSQKGLSVRVAVSPDLSAIGLRNFQRPGTNVGLLLEYRLTSRWSVQAGAIRSTKVYKALPSDYKWPAGWNWRLMPESISGRCNVIDMPINLRYDVALRPQLKGQAISRWFVSGGVTTYIMQQEKYVYNYPVDAHIYPGTQKERNERTGLYGFSQLNVSAGYERALSRRLSWQVEPFVKVPLKGVGYFKINLLSTGAFFSLRYKF